MNTKKLTSRDGKFIYVNLDLATSIWQSSRGNVTVIRFSDKNDVFVTETPEEIFQLPSVYNVQ